MNYLYSICNSECHEHYIFYTCAFLRCAPFQTTSSNQHCIDLFRQDMIWVGRKIRRIRIAAYVVPSVMGHHTTLYEWLRHNVSHAINNIHIQHVIFIKPYSLRNIPQITSETFCRLVAMRPALCLQPHRHRRPTKYAAATAHSKLI